MSGDVQPRKRKDRKKRKDDVDQIPEKPHVSVFSNNTLNNEDVNIHVHKDEGTGGGICAKLVFFILFSALAVLIGLIITEHRGLTDLETIDPNSKFSQLFEGWVDSSSHDEHDEHDLNAIDDPDDDHHEYDSDHADEDEHDDHLDENDNEDLDDNNEKSIEAEYSEEQDDDEDDEELEPIQDDDEGTDEEPEDEDADENNLNEIDDEDDNDEDNDTIEESKESGEVAASEEDDIEQDREEDDENDQDENQKDTEEYDDDNDQEVEEADGDQDIEEREDKDEEAEVGDEKRDNSDEQLNDEDEVDNSKDDDEAYDQDIGGDDHENKQEGDITTIKGVGDEKDEDKDDAHKDTLSNNKEAIKEEKIQLESKIRETVTKDTEKVEDDDPGSSGMAVKLGVGVALLVVAHLVLVKKWRNADDETLPSAENPPPTLQDRRNTIIVPTTFKEVESDMEQFVEDFADEDEENEGEENTGEKSESNFAKAKYQELATAYTRPVLESKYNRELAQGDYEYEDEEEEQYQKEVEDEEEEEDDDEESEDEVGEGEEYDDEEVEDVDDEDDELLKRLEARYGKLQKDNDSKPTENRDYDFDKHTEDNDYENTNIATEDDYRIRKQIDEAESSVKNNSTHAIVLFDKLLQKFPSSPRYLYGKAMALDILADQKRSNQLLEKSLQIYVQVLQTENVPTALYKLVADRCINRMRFIGQYKNAIAVHKLIIKRFPDDPQHLNSLVVTYLTVNRIEDARTVLEEILTKWPEDGFALVHYGFILKTTDNKLEESVRYLKKGISTKDEGVIDGRFYFHLGDALVRLGRRVEADKIYEEGRRNKVFLSKYQRSLYNVPRLSAKPWWSFKDLPSYSKSLSLLAASWKQIRDEGLNILNERGYFQDESENLRHTGEWKQFELFARGQKNIRNCKICPITCNIINQIPEANSCKRGQTKFSVMHPRTHIWPHCGPTNCRLRAHLGLKIPTNTFIRVADDTKGWKEGELLIFDDSFEHEVWHNGTDFRLILIVDIWHPELTHAERKSLSPI